MLQEMSELEETLNQFKKTILIEYITKISSPIEEYRQTILNRLKRKEDAK